MAHLDDTLYSMLNNQQDRYLILKGSLYDSNYKAIKGYLGQTDLSDKDLARVVMFITKLQLSAIRTYTIAMEDTIVVQRNLYPNSKLYRLVERCLGAFPYLSMRDTRYEVYFKFDRMEYYVRDSACYFEGILSFYRNLRCEIYKIYNKLEETYPTLEGVDREDLITFANGYLIRLLQSYILGTKSYLTVDYSILRGFLLEEEISLLTKKLVESGVVSIAEKRSSGFQGTDAYKSTYLYLELDITKGRYATKADTKGINPIYQFFKEQGTIENEALLNQLKIEELG